jgi:DNA (cytosine-5)-methyltransferase 1
MLSKSTSNKSASNCLSLDLFAGCGGLSLGFRTAGFDILGGVEIDATAAATHGANFHPGDALHGAPLDVHLDTGDLLTRLGHTPNIRVDVLMGGPPCQAFARVGRAKLRAESTRRNAVASDHAWLHDPRTNLYRRYLHYVSALRPDALLMENVPDAMNHGGLDVADAMCEALESLGYQTSYTLLNAVHYGVPQMRLRLFLVAYHKRLRVGPIRWPQPTHSHALPSGYEGVRAVATKPLRQARQGQVGRAVTHPRFRETSPGAEGLPPAITAQDALGDLPPMLAAQLAATGELRRGARSLEDKISYGCNAHSAYARLMRRWPGFEAHGKTTAHVIRYLPRDFKLFQKLAPGDDYPRAHELAERMFKEHLGHMSRRSRPMVDSEEWNAIRAQYVPPYDPTKFPNKWRKMEPDRPARTLMAHLGKDSYSHIHYSHEQGRTISVREAARLQSFPDGFHFCGSMNAGFRQIGNAVPPLLAYALARTMREQLGLTQAADIREQSGLIRRGRSLAADISSTAPAAAR